MNVISDRVINLLKRIHAPVVVGVPPANAFRDLVRLPDGELRHYGFRLAGKAGVPIYLASRDGGLSWQEFPVPEGCPGACVQSPWSGDWLTLLDAHDCIVENKCESVPFGMADGLYVGRSSVGIDGPFTFTRASERRYAMPRLPVPLRSRKRWVLPIQFRDPAGQNHVVALLSDDDGRQWRPRQLADFPAHTATGHHRGVRWQNYGCEPTLAELADGRLWLVIRTSMDTHYESYSEDAGETWSPPAPSRFYGTITMPTFFRLRDGRLLFFWCNTTPLPELDHGQQPELLDWERQGYGEDVFTNRDAFHAAISEDDGRTWIGFRELLLNERRNDSDFRTSGGNAECLDKSVHQSQAVELPEGKVLVSVGQHPLCRRLLIFDPAWLYETERADDFHLGLGGWSVQQYVKGIVGNFKGITGHCSYNRRPGAQLVPDPDGQPREVLQVALHPDPRLVHERQGAVWNFPAGKAGQVRISLRLPEGGQGVRLCLMDRWFNPVDDLAWESAQYVMEIDGAGRLRGTASVLAKNVWQEVTISWIDCAGKQAIGVAGPDAVVALPLGIPSGNGICYLHIQSLAAAADPVGVLIREVAAKTGVR